MCIRDRFICNRRKLIEQEATQNGTPTGSTTSTNTVTPKSENSANKQNHQQPLQRQYGNANLAELYVEEEDHKDSDSITDQEFIGLLANATHLKMFMTQITRHKASDEISISIEERHMNLSWSFSNDTFIMISDNGANSCLISTKSFFIKSVVQNRFATIKGCKDSYDSNGNRIGTGLAVVVCQDQVFGICINEAAIHDEDLTLLSAVSYTHLTLPTIYSV